MVKNLTAKSKALNKKWKWTTMFFIGSIFALILSFLLDDAAFRFMDLIGNSVLDAILQPLMGFYSVLVYAAILAVMLFAYKKKENILPLVLSVVVSFLACYFLKFAFMQPRPEEGELMLPLLGVHDYSFPSGHSTTAFSTVPAIGRALPKLKWLWIAVAFVFAFSRVYFGVHHLSDVVAGSILGVIIGELFLYFQIRKTLGKHDGKRKTA